MSNYNNYNYDPGHEPDPGSGKKTPQDSNVWDTLSWVIDVGLIFVWFPVGLVLTIAKASGHDVVAKVAQGIKQRRTASNASRPAYAQPGQASYAPDPTGRKSDTREKNDRKTKTSDGIRHADAGSTVMTVFGWILVAFGALGALSAAAAAGTAWAMLTNIAVAVGGGAMLFSANLGRKKEAKFKRCFTVSGKTGIVNIARLTKTVGLPDAEIDRILSEMIDRGFYGARAYIDHARGLLVIDPEEMRDVYRAEDEAKQAEAAKPGRNAETVYEQYIDAIRQADVEIEDEAMSEKIRRMQALTGAIFAEVEAHPEKKPQIERFMNYYLPTTLKLLNSYARIEAQGVSGSNMAKAKADIERIADTLVTGYEKQLDTLYGAEAMDIAGDVSVIENMMKRDGLTGKTDFGQTMGGH